MITRIIELSCDVANCDVAYAPSPTEMTSLQATRIGSLVAGWSRRDGKDFCPTHRGVHQAALIEKIRDLAGKQYDDARIGAAVGLARWAVQQLRSQHGIPPGVGPGRPPILGRRRGQVSS